MANWWEQYPVVGGTATAPPPVAPDAGGNWWEQYESVELPPAPDPGPLPSVPPEMAEFPVGATEAAPSNGDAEHQAGMANIRGMGADRLAEQPRTEALDHYQSINRLRGNVEDQFGIDVPDGMPLPDLYPVAPEDQASVDAFNQTLAGVQDQRQLDAQSNLADYEASAPRTLDANEHPSGSRHLNDQGRWDQQQAERLKRTAKPNYTAARRLSNRGEGGFKSSFTDDFRREYARTGKVPQSMIDEAISANPEYQQASPSERKAAVERFTQEIERLWQSEQMDMEGLRQEIAGATEHQAWLDNAPNWSKQDKNVYLEHLPVPITKAIREDPELMQQYRYVNELIAGEPLLSDYDSDAELHPDALATRRDAIRMNREEMLASGMSPDDYLASMYAGQGAQWLVPRLGEAVWEGVKRGTYNMTAGAVNALGDAIGQAMGQDTSWHQEDTTRRQAREGFREGVEQQKDARSAVGGGVAGTLRHGAEAFGEMLPAAVAGGALGKGLAAAGGYSAATAEGLSAAQAARATALGTRSVYGAIGAQVGSQTYSQKRAEGWSASEALPYAMAQAAVEVITEIGGGKVADKLGVLNPEGMFTAGGRKIVADAMRKGGANAVLKGIVSSTGEGLEEVAAELGNYFVDRLAGVDHELTAAGLGEAFLLGALVGGYANGSAAILNFVANPSKKNRAAAGIPEDAARTKPEREALAAQVIEAAAPQYAPTSQEIASPEPLTAPLPGGEAVEAPVTPVDALPTDAASEPEVVPIAPTEAAEGVARAPEAPTSVPAGAEDPAGKPWELTEGERAEADRIKQKIMAGVELTPEERRAAEAHEKKFSRRQSASAKEAAEMSHSDFQAWSNSKMADISDGDFDAAIKLNAAAILRGDEHFHKAVVNRVLERGERLGAQLENARENGADESRLADLESWVDAVYETANSLKRAWDKNHSPAPAPPRKKRLGDKKGAAAPTEVYPIGHRMWSAGDEVEVIGEPQEISGGEFQEVRVIETGKVKVVPTPRHVDANVQRSQQQWRDQQEGFKRLGEKNAPTPAPISETVSNIPEAPAAPETERDRLLRKRREETNARNIRTNTGASPSQAKGWIRDAISRRPEGVNTPAEVAAWIERGFGNENYWKLLKQDGVTLEEAVAREMQPKAVAPEVAPPVESTAQEDSSAQETPLWEMSQADLEQAHDFARAQDKTLLNRLFGDEGAKKYQAARRRANDMMRPQDQTREAARIVEEMEESLSQAQQDELFGVNLPDHLNPEAIKPYLDAMGAIDDSSPRELGNSIGYQLTQLGQETDPANMSGTERVAWAVMQEAFDIAQERGWSTKEVSDAAVRRAAGRFSDPADAEFVLRRFIKEQPPQQPTAEPARIEAPKPKKRLGDKRAPVEKAVEPPAPQPEAAVGDRGESVSRKEGGIREKKPARDSKKILAKAGLTITETKTKNGNPVWAVGGKTYEHRAMLKELGGSYYGRTKTWSFYDDPIERIADRLAGKGDGDSTGSSPPSDAAVERAVYRQRESERPDEQGTSGDFARYVGDGTRALIEVGGKFGIPAEVTAGQIEDVGRIARAFDMQKPMFLIGSAPGMGKTFVLGGAIRELRRLGAKKFVYVTENQDLVEQVQANLADYGLEGVEFVTYAKLRDKATKVDAFDAVVLLDEAHNAKNPTTSTSKAVQKLVADSRFAVYATATPFENVSEAVYLAPTGIFDGIAATVTRKSGGRTYSNELHGFHAWAWIHGAEVYFPKQGPPRVYWPKRQDAVEAQQMANEWLRKRGVYNQRPMALPPKMVRSKMTAHDAADEYVTLYNQVQAAYDEAEEMAEDDALKARVNMHRANLSKRILEAAKIPSAIARAKELIDAGKQVLVFVNTKSDRAIGGYKLSEPYRKEHGIKGAAAERIYEYPEIQQMMANHAEAVREARMMKEKAPPAPFAAEIVLIASAMHMHGRRFDLPSVADEIINAFPKGTFGEYTGRVSVAKGKTDLNAWKAGKTMGLVATMDKGGTGMSYHDTTGKMPDRVQLNINLPWSGTQVEQVAGRLGRLGLARPVDVEWLFSRNIPFEVSLTKTVGSRMRSMGAAVQGIDDQKARRVQDFEFDPAEENPPPIPPSKAAAVVGDATEIEAPDMPAIPARYAVVELASLIPSHDYTQGSVAPNVAYPPNLQPRDYKRGGDEDMKVHKLSEQKKPGFYISDHPAADNGPPSMTPEGIVINGNGRVMSLQLAGHKNDLKWYSDYLAKRAKNYGIDQQKLKGMENPVLVRIVEMDPTSPEAQKFAAAGNVSSTQKQSPVKTAESLSRLLDASVLDSMPIEDDSTFSESVKGTNKAAREFRDIIRKSLPTTETSTYFTDSGGLTDAGAELIRAMLLLKVVPADIIEKLSATRKQLLNSVEGATPQLLKLKRDYPDADIGPQLVEALDFYAEFPSVKDLGEIKDIFSQQSIFGGEEVSATPGGRMLIDFIHQNGNKPLVFRKKLIQLSREAGTAGGMFASEPIEELAAEILDVQKREGATFGGKPQRIKRGIEKGLSAPPQRKLGGKQGDGGGLSGDARMAATAARKPTVTPPTKQTLSTNVGTPDDPAGIAAQDIVKTWQRIFDIPIRSGYSRRSEGIYNYFPETIRVKEKHVANLAVAAHEIAHHIDKQTGVSQPKALPEHLRNELAGLDYEPKGRVFEGWAEFIRHYITEQDAGKVAPNFFQHFERTWLPAHPEIAKKLREARQHARKYADQTVFQRVKAAMSAGAGDDIAWGERFKRKMKNRMVRLYANLHENTLGASLLDNRLAAKGYKGPSLERTILAYRGHERHNAARALEHGVFDLQTGEVIGKGGYWERINKHLQSDAEVEESTHYAHARHVLFMADKKPGYNAGMTVEDAQAIVDSVAADPDKQHRYEEVSKTIAAFSHELLDMAVRAGRFPMAERNKIVNYYGDNYFPLWRVRPGMLSRIMGGKGYFNLPKLVKGRSKEGSGAKVRNPHDVIQLMAIEYYRGAAEGRVARALVEALDPGRGGAEGMGWAMERLPPHMLATKAQIAEVLDTLVEQGMIEADDAKAMKIAAQILGKLDSSPSAKNLEWFADRHGLPRDADLADLREAAETEPDAGAQIALWRPNYKADAGKKIAVYYDKDGNPTLYQFDDFLYDSFVAMGDVYMPWGLRVWEELTRIFKTGAVSLSSKFAVQNPISDIQEYFGRAREAKGKDVFAKPFSLGAQYAWYKSQQAVGLKPEPNALFDAFDEMGGRMYTAVGQEAKQLTRERHRRLGQKKAVNAVRHLGETFYAILGKVQSGIAVTDVPARLAEMEASIKSAGYERAGDKWRDLSNDSLIDRLPEQVRIDAIFAAGEATTNFARRGNWYRYIELFAPLSNANAQALRRRAGLLTNLRNVRSDKKKAREAAQRYAYYLATYFVVGQIWGYLRSDDDDYVEGEGWLYGDYFVTKGDQGEAGSKFRKPRDAASIIAIGEAVGARMAGNAAPRPIGQAVARDVTASVPAGGGIARALFEAFVTNKDYFFQREVEPSYMERENVPDQYRYDGSDTGVSKAIGYYSGKYLGISPAEVEHVLSGTTGGMYRRLAQAWDAAMAGELDWSNVPFASGIVVNRWQAKSLNDFYEELDKAAEAASEATLDVEHLGETPERTKAIERTDAEAKRLNEYADLMKDIRAAEKKSIGKRNYEYQPYLVGLARDAMGRPPLESNPNPLTDPSTPKPIAGIIEKFAERKANSAILSHGQPERKKKDGKFTEPEADFNERTAKWQAKRQAALAWLREHKDSPAVQDALEETFGKPYTSLWKGDKPHAEKVRAKKLKAEFGF